MTGHDLHAPAIAVAETVTVAPTSWAVVSAFLVFIGGTVAMAGLAKSLGHAVRVGAALHTWHSFFSLTYAWYVVTYGGDATGYYRVALAGTAELDLGTPMVSIIAEYIIGITATSFLGVSLVFNLAGSIGLLLLYDLLVDHLQRWHRTSNEVDLDCCPDAVRELLDIGPGQGQHRLSCHIDGRLVCFPARLSGERRHSSPSACLLLVRPHIAVVALFSLLLAGLGSPSGRLVHRLAYSAFVGAMISLVLPVAITYVGLEGATGIADVDDYIGQRQQYNQQGEAGVDISNLPVPLQMLTYLYRPLPHEAWSIFALMASAEVLFLLALTALAVQATVLDGRRRAVHPPLTLWLFALAGLYLLASTTANLGIAVRQKWMIMPAVLALLFTTIVRAQTTESGAANDRRLITSGTEHGHGLAGRSRVVPLRPPR